MDRIQLGLLTVLAGLLVIVALYYVQNYEARGSGDPTFLIVGLNGAGKSALFQKLTTGGFVPTVSSLEPARAAVGLPLSHAAIQKPYQLIDYPGYLKYENLFKNLLSTISLRGILFVVDADMTSFSRAAPDVAVKLLKLLRLTEQDPDGVNFLFAVNKADLFNALPVTKVKRTLEQEMGALIRAKLAERRHDDDDDDDLDYWAQFQDFRFDSMRGNMDFVAGSVLKGNVQPWENWLDERVVN